MDEYKPNSHKSRDEKAPDKKIEKIVTGEVRTVKKGGLQKIADEFISEDAKNVKSYALSSILIPALKKAVCDIIKDGADIIFYGERGRRGNSPASSLSYRSYDKEYDRRYDRDSDPRSRSGYNYENVFIRDRFEAEEVLNRMDELIQSYGTASVADLYDLAGITSKWTDNKYGWTDVHSARAVPDRDGYVLKFPRALPLD